MTYSSRYGHKSIQPLMVSEISQTLKNGIIDGLEFIFLDKIYGLYRDLKSDDFTLKCQILWHHLFREPISYIPSGPDEAKQSILKKVYESNFPVFYDYIEFFADFDRFEIGDIQKTNDEFITWCNRIFEREIAPIRFVSGLLVELTNENEIKEVEIALRSKNQAIAGHIKNALRLLSDRKAPDNRNSIKESISAVEAAAKILVGDKNTTLGKALGQLEKKNGLHPALNSGFSSIYGWTSGQSGIRHAMMEKDTVTEADARFMLVACSAFSNYLLAQIEPNGDKN